MKLAIQTVAAYLSLCGLAFAAPPPADQQAPAAKAKALPVILLTGFEPFGAKRPPNPSWEGIKNLDGREWNGYRIVAKQMPVVWGAPLTNIDQWIDEYRPQAVFSFGQGGRTFELESRGRKTRGKIQDNDGKLPPAASIVPDGPDEYRSTADLQALAAKLAAGGREVRISDNAGAYLCEETLYSVEHLRATRKLNATVVFCHVPMLGTKINGKPFTADDMQAFVLDLLDAWRTTQANVKTGRTGIPAVFAAMMQAPAAPADSREPEVRQFIEHYFRTWSNQDINGYGDCFAASAAIQYLDDQNRLYTYNKTNFVEDQRAVHARAPQRIVEVPERIEITFEAKLVRAVVYWKLTAGSRLEYGYDHFTLVRQGDGWKIVNLVFYGEEAAKAR